MKRFEARIWEKAEHWYFDTQVEARDEDHARLVIKREYPPRHYSLRELRAMS